MKFSSLEGWLQWQQSSHGLAIDMGLERVGEVARILGLLRPSAQVITVAGTNGKGSCVAALEAIISAAGMRCGAYTSPHLLRYNERVKVNREQASDEALCRAFAVIDEARGDISLTYFEFGTLAALYLFSRSALDYWILEVGLGGRLDATNVIDADIAIVTSVDIDHSEWLGNSRELIGREKAGIFRPGRPALCADAQAPKSVIDHATMLGSAFAQIGKDFGFREVGEQTVFWSGGHESAPLTVNLSKPSLAAAYHAARLLNLPNALGAADAFVGLQLPGRMQQLHVHGKTIILDVAHNPAAMEQLARQLSRHVGGGSLAAVIAMMGDKNLPQSLAPLCPQVDEWALCSIADLPRAASTAALSEALPSSCKRVVYPSVAAALSTLIGQTEIACILVAGSFYTVAEAHTWLEQNGSWNEAAG